MSFSFKADYESIKFVLERLNGELHVKLNDWEKRFVKDLQIRQNNMNPLTTKQLNKLSDIWEKY